MALIMLKKSPSTPSLSVFIMKRFWILSNAFSVSVEMIVLFLSFIQLIWYITLVDFSYAKLTFHSWEKSYLVMGYDLFICRWIRFAGILLRIFASVFIRDIGL